MQNRTDVSTTHYNKKQYNVHAHWKHFHPFIAGEVQTKCNLQYTKEDYKTYTSWDEVYDSNVKHYSYLVTHTHRITVSIHSFI